MKHLLLLAVLLTGTMPAFARQQQSGFSNQCFDEVYREEYIPGTRDRPGYIERWVETVEVPCARATTLSPAPIRSRNVDDNSCIEGAVLGGLAGGALGGTLATQDNWIWSIPAGLIGGSMLGCQIDGG